MLRMGDRAALLGHISGVKSSHSETVEPHEMSQWHGHSDSSQMGPQGIRCQVTLKLEWKVNKKGIRSCCSHGLLGVHLSLVPCLTACCCR